MERWQIDAFSDPSRKGFQMMVSYLATKKLRRKRERELDAHEERLPCRVSGEELRKLEEEFGWKLTVVDRGPTMSTYAVAKHHLLAVKNRRIKSWDGEEVIEFDRDMMSMAVKNEGWVHSCRTYRTAEIAAGYERQEIALLKATEGVRMDIRATASGLMSEVRSGGGERICLNAATCGRVADTLLVDVTRVDVSATQLAAAMEQHQARRAKVFFYFEPDMYVQDDGELSSMRGRYLIDRDADLLHIFPDGQTIIQHSCHYSNLVSYLLEAEVVHNGQRYAIEVHDSQPGVMFAQMVRADFVAEYDTEVETRFYRPSGQEMVVVEQSWVPPGSDAQEFSRIVVSKRLHEKVKARMLSYPEAKLTIENARLAVRDYTNQEVVRSTVVMSTEHYRTHVPEQLAMAEHKHALQLRAETEVELRALREGGMLKTFDRRSWVSAALSGVHSAGAAIRDAVAEVPSAFVNGYAIEADYTVRIFPLDAGYVVRNLVRADGKAPVDYRSVSYMPGGRRTGAALSSVSSTDEVLARARAQSVVRQLDEADEVFYECEQVVEEVSVKRHAPMTRERAELVEKMKDAYDAHGDLLGPRVQVEGTYQSMPLCSVEPKVDDPDVVINEEYFALFPDLKGVDLGVRAHMLSAEDHVVALQAPRVEMNASRDEVAKPLRVRKSKVRTAGGGRRPLTQVEAALAFSKRVANAPRADHERNFSQMMEEHFKRFADVCFQRDWQERVAARVKSGMWSSRVSELERNVSKLETTKVSTMLREAFCTGTIDMTKWKAMVKTVPKPQMSSAAASEHKATQTILYQDSKMTNSLFSSMLTEFHDTLDEVLRPEVRVNVRRDRGDMERWFNSWQIRRVSAGDRLKVYESDISQCDKSHTIYNLLAYLHFLSKFGAPDALLDVWHVMIGEKTASSSLVAFLIGFFEQLLSGAFWTISVNSVLTAVAVVNSMELERKDVVSAQFTGDDSLVEAVRTIHLLAVTERMRVDYNFESKTYRVIVPYFCGRYYVYYDGYWFLLKDPLKAAEAKGRYVSAVADLKELYQSYDDDMQHYDKKEVLDRLADCVAVRHEFPRSPRGLIGGLAAYKDEGKFMASYETELSLLVA